MDEIYHTVGIEVRRSGRGVVKQGGGSEEKCVGEYVRPCKVGGGGNVMLPSRLNRIVPREKRSTGSVHKYAIGYLFHHLKIIVRK